MSITNNTARTGQIKEGYSNTQTDNECNTIHQIVKLEIEPLDTNLRPARPLKPLSSLHYSALPCAAMAKNPFKHFRIVIQITIKISC